jgi:hypothetical protein
MVPRIKQYDSFSFEEITNLIFPLGVSVIENGVEKIFLLPY